LVQVDGTRSTEARVPIAIAVVFTLLGGLPLFLVTAYSVTLQSEFGFGGSELGFAVSGYFVGAMVAAQGGFVIDRLGVSFGLRASALLSASSGILIASIARSWQMIAVSLVLSGMANSVGQLASNRMLASLQRQGLGFGMKQAAAPLTPLTAGFIVSLVGIHAPWRWVFLAVSCATAGAAVALPSRLVSSGSRSPATGPLGMARSQLLTLAVGGALGGAAGNSLALLAVDSLSKVGFSEAAAVMVLTTSSGMAVAARVGAGWWLDHTGTDGYRELIFLMIAGALGLLVISGGGVVGDNRLLVFLGMSLAFSTGWAWPAIIYFVAVRNTPVQPATATGVIMTGVFVGTLIGAPTLAVVADHTSYTVAWAAASVVALVAAGFASLSRRLSAA